LQCSFSDEIPLDADNTVFLQHYVNRQEGTYSIRVRYTQGYSWIGIGVNYYDEAYMVPAYTVIGRQEEDEDGSLPVARYWLERTFITGVVPIEDPNGHLKPGASLVQENGETVLEFTHDLVILEEGIVYENITDDSTWIWAVGPPDNDWGMRHTLQGSFSIELSETCVDPSAPGATNPANDTTPLPWGGGGDGNSDVVEGDATTEAESSANIVFNEPQTRTSRGLWITHGLFMGFAWGILAPLAIGASFFRNLVFLEKDVRWFKLHMYLNLAVAFLTFVGFFLAVRATNKEGGQSHFKDDSHHKTGLTIFLFVLAQCFLGYFRPSKESSNASRAKEGNQVTKEIGDDGNIPKEDSTTILAESTEKAAAKSSEEDQGFELDMAEITAMTEKTDEKDANELDVSKDDDSWSLFTPPPPPSDEKEDGEGQEMEPKSSLHADASSRSAADDSYHKWVLRVSDLRAYWKYAHRIMGIILIALAWFNCHTGIELFSVKYSTDNEQQLLNVFWGFTGTIAVVFLLQGYVLRQ
jgi:hypothetical protein